MTYTPHSSSTTHHHPSLDLLAPLRYWLNNWKIQNAKLAHFLCRLIPCTCPFAREIRLGNWAFNIPPLCKLNPLYNEVSYLRLRALSYLADQCGEDINHYIC